MVKVGSWTGAVLGDGRSTAGAGLGNRMGRPAVFGLPKKTEEATMEHVAC
jgi:hypothetical protein